MSKARTLKETPHGRRCGLDVWPIGFNPRKSFAEQEFAGMREKFLEYVEFVEQFGKPLGIISGSRFRAFGVDGDLPHCELEHWATKYRFPDGAPVSKEPNHV